MYRAVHVTVNQGAHDIGVGGHADIADVLRQPHIESLTCCGALDFWFSPSLITDQQVNTFATDLFLVATSSFGATNVPLFYGDVVVASHNSVGALADLTSCHIDRLRGALGWRREWILGWRYDFAKRRAKHYALSQMSGPAERIHRGF